MCIVPEGQTIRRGQIPAQEGVLQQPLASVEQEFRDSFRGRRLTRAEPVLVQGLGGLLFRSLAGEGCTTRSPASRAQQGFDLVSLLLLGSGDREPVSMGRARRRFSNRHLALAEFSSPGSIRCKSQRVGHLSAQVRIGPEKSPFRKLYGKAVFRS